MRAIQQESNTDNIALLEWKQYILTSLPFISSKKRQIEAEAQECESLVVYRRLPAR